MKRVFSVALVVLAVSCFSGCGVRESQQRAAGTLGAVPAERAQVTLYTLDPKLAASASITNEKVFHGFNILGKANIGSEVEKKALLDALASGIPMSPPIAPSCFYPRHGLAIRSGTNNSDYVICFECRKVRVYNPRGNFLVTTSARDTFNEVATAHRLPIAGERQ